MWSCYNKAVMKVLILYRPHSEHSSSVDNFVRDLERIYPGNKVVLTDVDSVEGIQQLQLYDILQYPSVLVLADDGSVLNSWVGEPLPLVDSVAGYLRG
jgi:hypothetical protein